jgi:hypothetical protein
MVRFRCPECGTDTEVTAEYGGEIVSVYCLKHTGGADLHTRPVYMTRESTVAAPNAPREPVPA